MDGFVMAHGACLVCKRLFGFNPVSVPSLRGEPICESCMQRVNAGREKLGMPPVRIPEDAYGPAPAGEVF